MSKSIAIESSLIKSFASVVSIKIYVDFNNFRDDNASNHPLKTIIIPKSNCRLLVIHSLYCSKQLNGI
jgi:hypothetical protein